MGDKTARKRVSSSEIISEHMKRIGAKGGKARMLNTTPEQRSEQAKRAAATREAKRVK